MGGYEGPGVFVPPPQRVDPGEQVGKLLQMKSMLGQQQLQQSQLQGSQIENQMHQMDVDSTKAFQRAYTEAQGDPDKTQKLAAQYGAKPTALLQWQSAVTAQKLQVADLVAKNATETKRQADLMQGAHDQIAALPEEQRAAAWPQVAQSLSAQGVDISKLAPQYPGAQAFQMLGFQAKQHTQNVEEALKGAEQQKNASQAGEADASKKLKDMEANYYQANGGAPGVPTETMGLMDYMRKPPAPGEPMHTPANYPAWKAKQEAIATAPQKEAVAREEGIARASIEAQIARGSNAALASVPQHLVGPATEAATKAGTEYAQAQSVTQRIQSMMDAAHKGNVVSYQLLPEEGALQVVTAQGIHRINMAEISNYGGGSLWQRLEGHVGKALTGQSIPDTVLTDMADIQKIMGEGAETKYKNTLKTVNQYYGSKFEPVTMDAMPRNQPSNNQPSNTPAPTGKAVSLAAARQLAQNKGKSDDEITADIKAHGYTVKP
jgi:hypothetical protein